MSHFLPCLYTQRLTCIAATAAHVRTELETDGGLAALLDAEISPAWPPGEYDREAMLFFLARLEQGGRAAEGWYSWYALCPNGPAGRRTLVGAAGFFGPPTGDGSVEVGYSVLPDWQGRGFATEMVQGLVRHAFGFPGVRRVIARTTGENPASVRVLAKAGFHAADSEEPGVLFFVRSRGLPLRPAG